MERNFLRFFLFLLCLMIDSCLSKPKAILDDIDISTADVDFSFSEDIDIFDASSLPDHDSLSYPHPARWTISKEKISWTTNLPFKFYQWGTAKMDAVKFMLQAKSGLFLVGSTNMSLDGSTDADAYLKVVYPDDTVTTYSFGTDRIDWGSALTLDQNELVLIIGATNGDMGRKWDKTQKDWMDAFLLSLDQRNDAFSFFQWGNDKASDPQIIYQEEDGSVIVIGMTNGSFEGQVLHGKNDLFISKIRDGRVFTTQFGPEMNASIFIGNRRIVKTTTTIFFSAVVENGALPGQTFFGEGDGAIVAIDRKTLTPSFYQIGTSANDMIDGLTEGSDKNIYFVGATYGAFPSYSNQGDSDFFYGYLDVINKRIFIKNQTGSSKRDVARSPVFHKNTLYHVGRSDGSCGESFSSNYDQGCLVGLNPSFGIAKCLLFGDPSRTSDAGLLVITSDPENRVYVAGTTYGTLGSAFFGDGSADSFDSFLMTALLADLGFNK